MPSCSRRNWRAGAPFSSSLRLQSTQRQTAACSKFSLASASSWSALWISILPRRCRTASGQSCFQKTDALRFNLNNCKFTLHWRSLLGWRSLSCYFFSWYALKVMSRSSSLPSFALSSWMVCSCLPYLFIMGTHFNIKPRPHPAWHILLAAPGSVCEHSGHHLN